MASPSRSDTDPELDIEERAEAPPEVDGRIRAVGTALGQALSDVLAALPDAPHRPNQLARDLGVNRAVASRLLNATGRRDPLEVLHYVPGLEPLRKVVRAARGLGVAHDLAQAADLAIARFDRLIRDDAGTRPALDAMISSNLPGARERFELANKYSVFKGLSQLKGVCADHWLGTAVIWPSAENPERLDLVWLNGAVAMQRIRPGVTARFGYRYRSGDEPDNSDEGDAVDDEPGIEQLDRFCVNPPAKLEATRIGKTVQYTLPDDILGPKQAVDMFVVDHHLGAMRRYAADDPLARSALFVEPAMPVGTLLFDVLLHEQAFPGSDPELVVFDTGYDGIANVNDRSRDMDRVDIEESVEYLGVDLSRVRATEIANYPAMLQHLGERFGWNPKDFRGYRTRVRYPVYGWQVSMSFKTPAAPGSAGQEDS